MTVESSAIPFPSEIVIPPAGALAHEGKMSLWLIVVCGMVGSVLGALINYGVAYYLGRPFFEKYGKYVLVTEEKIKRSEEFFEKYGAVATLICRFITVVRQLVSLPAGFSKMRLQPFILYTAIGSAIWSMILAFLGYFAGAGEETIKAYKTPITIGTVVAAGLVLTAFLAYKYTQKRRQAGAQAATGE
ncbi:MAG: DedA family protein [Deltaproteobacteria bacterium]|nr:DedA family protein [bacterium]MCB9475470.1 DedA family protein [Deltaproteobacteria bacterium]MCB9488527.1 DedA family protein [Deltaproteobacteria bacterium]